MLEKTCKIHGKLNQDDISVEKNPKLKSGISLKCRICKVDRDRIWKDLHRDQHIQSSTRWKNEHREKYREWQREDRKNNPDKYRSYQDNYKNKHGDRKTTLEIIRIRGISFESYAQLIVDQKNLCAICEKPETRKSRTGESVTRLCMDHDHKTGKVRSLLCHDCNTALGKFKDDISLIKKAIAYLVKHGTPDDS